MANVFISTWFKWRKKAQQKLCTHRRKGVLREGSWTYKQVFAYFLSYFKAIIKIADPGWIFHVGWAGWELRPSGSSSAFLAFKREVVVFCERKQRCSVMVHWLRDECHTTHTYWWIFHVQPQSEQQKTLMFVCTSVLPSCIQVALIMTYYSNTKRKYKGFTLAYYKSCSEEENFFPFCYGECNFHIDGNETFLSVHPKLLFSNTVFLES